MKQLILHSLIYIFENAEFSNKEIEHIYFLPSNLFFFYRLLLFTRFSMQEKVGKKRNEVITKKKEKLSAFAFTHDFLKRQSGF